MEMGGAAESHMRQTPWFKRPQCDISHGNQSDEVRKAVIRYHPIPFWDYPIKGSTIAGSQFARAWSFLEIAVLQSLSGSSSPANRSAPIAGTFTANSCR